jgi:hypothetical protein
MKIADLVKEWESTAGGMLTARSYSMRLPLYDAARLAALGEMYPRRSESELISELLTAALDELERAMPYVRGSRVIAQDDRGDPIYEDVGPSSRFHALSKKFSMQMEGDLARMLDR